MGFHDVKFPDDISYGSAGGPGFNTSIVELVSGAEERISRWASAKRRYNAGYGIKTPLQFYTAQEFYIARQGAANSFRYKDWADYATTVTGATHRTSDASVTGSDIIIGVGDGAKTVFQIIKTYISGGQTHSRTIKLPVNGTLLVEIDGAAQTETTDYTVSYTTGVITFITAPANSLNVTAGYEFDTPVRFGAEADQTFQTSIDSFDSGSIPDIPLVEERSSIADPEVLFNGGSEDFGTTTTVQTVTLIDGKAFRFNATSAHDVRLPDEVNIEAGGPIFFIRNAGTATITLKYADTTTTIDTILTLINKEVWLIELASGVKEWQTK